ncbi:MAG: hypothetical protein Q4P08_05980, partial [Eubacteriales bacterium]|nr:hypothetical protein [Eubacteriales bacterium]
MQAAMIDLRLLEELEAKNALEARVHSVFKTTINLEVEGFENLISLLHSSKSMQPNSIRLPALPKL